MSVYNYVAKNRSKVAYMKIRELAAQAHVSTTTVLHMCNKFGCDGYTEFEQRLKQEMLRDKRDVADLDISALQDFLARLNSVKPSQPNFLHICSTVVVETWACAASSRIFI